MTHTLHPEIENEIKNLFVEFANKHNPNENNPSTSSHLSYTDT